FGRGRGTAGPPRLRRLASVRARWRRLGARALGGGWGSGGGRPWAPRPGGAGGGGRGGGRGPRAGPRGGGPPRRGRRGARRRLGQRRAPPLAPRPAVARGERPVLRRRTAARARARRPPVPARPGPPPAARPRSPPAPEGPPDRRRACRGTSSRPSRRGRRCP